MAAKSILLPLIGVLLSLGVAWYATQLVTVPTRAVSEMETLCEYSAEMSDPQDRERFRTVCAGLIPQVERMTRLLAVDTAVFLIVAVSLFAVSVVGLVTNARHRRG